MIKQLINPEQMMRLTPVEACQALNLHRHPILLQDAFDHNLTRIGLEDRDGSPATPLSLSAGVLYRAGMTIPQDQQELRALIGSPDTHAKLKEAGYTDQQVALIKYIGNVYRDYGDKLPANFNE